MTLPARAGDTRRMWSALLHYQAGDMVGLDDVMTEAHNIGRGHHLVFAAFEYLADALQLGEHPERINDIRQEIARLDAVENSDTAQERTPTMTDTPTETTPTDEPVDLEARDDDVTRTPRRNSTPAPTTTTHPNATAKSNTANAHVQPKSN